MNSPVSRNQLRVSAAIALALFGWFVSLSGAEPAPRRIDAVRVREAVAAPVAERIRVEAVREARTTALLHLDPRKLSVAPLPAGARVIATDLAGREIPVHTTDGRVSVDPKPGQWVVVKPADVVAVEMTKGVQWLPGVCVPPTDGGSATEANTLRSYAKFAIAPVVWDTALDAYRMVASIGVAKNGDPSATGGLGTHALVKLAFEGVPVEPSEFRLDTAGFAGERTVEFTFPRTQIAAPRMIVRTNVAGEQPFVMNVRPRVEVTARKDPILGLGLEETSVIVECVQANGALLALAGDVPVVISCSGGQDSDANALRVSSQQAQKEFRIRSVGLGTIKVLASARLPSEELVGSVTVGTTLPWAQFVAALAGGALGGFARRFMKGARKSKTPTHVLEGVVVATIAYVAGVLGVGFLQLPAAIVATVAGAFLTGALTGFVGVMVIEQMTKKTRPTPTS
ncbi:MAG: hypothetical protein ACREIA_18565 [Opitutaceae bacterium]